MGRKKKVKEKGFRTLWNALKTNANNINNLFELREQGEDLKDISFVWRSILEWRNLERI